MVVSPNNPTYKFVKGYQYDSWSRLINIQYPDNESVLYDYDLGGNLKKVGSYISEIRYDEFEQKVYCRFGNSTIEEFTYTPDIRRLNSKVLFSAAGVTESENYLETSYDYDHVGNILEVVNNAPISSNGLGGIYNHSFEYDKLNRLNGGTGSWTGSPVRRGIYN